MPGERSVVPMTARFVAMAPTPGALRRLSALPYTLGVGMDGG